MFIGHLQVSSEMPVEQQVFHLLVKFVGEEAKGLRHKKESEIIRLSGKYSITLRRLRQQQDDT